MNTLFYRTTTPVSVQHKASFAECHQMHFPRNQLAIIPNVAGTECLIKCCGDMQLPVDFPLLGTLSKEQTDTLLSTVEWKHEVV
jgi:hypothetical protein